ncbi:MAG: DJ-1/PfpI family protein [Kiritimatiellae bacterium]|nr:DJ-1/PfpI family protein [Kiritimatiellia bacterium]
MARAMVPLADGVEEMEAVIIMDVLRRADWEVVSVGLKPAVVRASRGVKLQPDAVWDEVDPGVFDVLMLPGGAEGTATLAGDERVLDMVRTYAQAGKWLCAICAAPLVLQAAGVLQARHRVTCHPAVADKLTVTRCREERVVVDGHFVTSRGPGTAFEFALTVVMLVDGKDLVDDLTKALILPPM